MSDYYRAAGGFIFAKPHYLATTTADIVCTVPEAAEAYCYLQRGAAICQQRGHDFSVRVPNTPNMYLCFRCQEPGWEVPCVEPC